MEDRFSPARWTGQATKKSVQAVPRRARPGAPSGNEPDGYLKAKAALEAERVEDSEPAAAKPDYDKIITHAEADEAAKAADFTFVENEDGKKLTIAQKVIQLKSLE